MKKQQWEIVETGVPEMYAWEWVRDGERWIHLGKTEESQWVAACCSTGMIGGVFDCAYEAVHKLRKKLRQEYLEHPAVFAPICRQIRSAEVELHHIDPMGEHL